ncbi:hypothetical protein A7K95_08190 [Pediococcus parvulus]|uniref:Secreted protein n=1 Tax=Pediococcus parvulus TaxID=54062 RepID=A0ABX2UG52_9LACO|nr:hypothetical protein A7K95_08190 [Pediococcus parvulus]
MRDRNPAGIMLIICLLTCRAVLELSGKKQGKGGDVCGEQPRSDRAYTLLFVLSSGPRVQRKKAGQDGDVCGEQPRSNRAYTLLFVLSSGPRVQRKKVGQGRRCMRDRNPAGIMLIICLLTCRAVLELTKRARFHAIIWMASKFQLN